MGLSHLYFMQKKKKIPRDILILIQIVEKLVLTDSPFLHIGARRRLSVEKVKCSNPKCGWRILDIEEMRWEL